MQRFRTWIYQLIIPSDRVDNPEYNRRLLVLVGAILCASLSVFVILPPFFAFAGFSQGLMVCGASLFLLLLVSLILNFISSNRVKLEKEVFLP